MAVSTDLSWALPTSTDASSPTIPTSPTHSSTLPRKASPGTGPLLAKPPSTSLNPSSYPNQSFTFLNLPPLSLLPLMPPSMPLALSSSKWTQMETGIPVPSSPNHSLRLNKTTTSTIENSLLSFMPSNPGDITFMDVHSLLKSPLTTKT